MTKKPNRFPARASFYDKKVSLVLQGGGALGSYQAGVYEALASSEYLPDWIAGISIGAINAAIIAGKLARRAVEEFTRLLERNNRSYQLVAARVRLVIGRHAAAGQHIARLDGRSAWILRPAAIL